MSQPAATVNYAEKYGLTATHSAIVAAAEVVPAGKALDLGCGRGRNALYLQSKGFDVTAWDKNPASVQHLQHIISAEGLAHIAATAVDLNTQRLTEEYDFIFSTVVFMFLDAAAIPSLIAQMQSHTRPGGHNLIVTAIDSPDYPCSVPFSFTFQPGELKQHYQDWELLSYNEDVGELHRTDEQGNRIKMRFATMLARKP
ncbi:MAG: tellurite resistance methyltransferase TehB [Neisseriaceae bacterium]